MQLSPIQNHIISRLKNASSLRYSEIKPPEVPNDLYNYHLKALIGKRLIQKTGDGYCLTPNGHGYVADVHHASDQANRLFKVNVITIVARNIEGLTEILVQERRSQPSYGIIGVMGGTILKGESMAEGAHRKLKQETGLSGAFEIKGIERRRLYKKGDLFSDVLFPICLATHFSGELKHETEFGINYWTDINTAIKLDRRPFDSIISISKVLECIRDETIDSLPFFYEETVQSDI